MLDGDLHTAIRLHRRQAVAATQAHAIAFKEQLQVLTRLRAAPVTVGLQGQFEHVIRHPLALNHPGEYPVQAQRRVQQFQPSIDIAFAQPALRRQHP